MNKQTNERGQLIPFIQNGEYFFQRALKYYHQNQLHKAKKFLLRANKLEEKEPSYICQLAAVLSELGEYAESNKWLDYLLSEVDPDVTECYFFLANNYVHLGLLEKAEEEALYYLEVAPDGDFAEDAEDLLLFIGTELPSEYEEAFQENAIIKQHTQAKIKMEAGEFQEAIKLFKKMIQTEPSFWAAYNNLALAYFYSGNKEQAMATLENVLTKNPGNLHALCNLALFFHFIGLKQRSIDILQKLKAVYPIHHDLRYKLGSTFALLHEHEYAYQWLSSIRNTTFNDELPFYHWLAVSAFMTGRVQQAKRAWHHVEMLDPEGQVAAYYLRELKKGTLTANMVEYHYRLPESNKTYQDFLTKGLTKDEKSKLIHLYIVRKNMQDNGEGYEALEAFCSEEHEPLYLKELAACAMLKQRPDERIIIKHEGLEILYYIETELPETITAGFTVIEILQSFLKTGEFNDVIYRLWADIFKYASLHGVPFENARAWAAAVDYVWRKQSEQPVTQRDIASKYGISVATVGKYAKKINALLHEQQV